MARRYRRHPQTAGRIVGDLAFVVTADDHKVHNLNLAATHLWQLACAGDGCTADEAASYLIEHFEQPDEDSDGDGDGDLDPETAARDARECLDDLVARRILVVDP